MSNEEKVMNSLQTIEEWALQGMSYKEMAEMLEMSYASFRAIKGKNLALLALLEKCAIKRKEVLDEQVKTVEESLYKRAIGYNYTESVPVKVKEEILSKEGVKLNVEKVEVVRVEKHSPADIGAAKFYLLNKAKKIWQDNPHKVENDKAMLKIRKKEAAAKEF
ncbi:hypothetical protein [Niameybacter massiliensis]|uniref:hypothetical protein n=1 Tax=Niameybacter massiliensis TaxID=1658108 RepID=UPI0006B44CA9|nr:hypothetical protein [Niameybacter massiliensis]